MVKFILYCEGCKESREVSRSTYYRSKKTTGSTNAPCKKHCYKNKVKPVKKVKKRRKNAGYIKSMKKLDKDLASGKLLDGLGIYTKVNVFKKYGIAS